MKKKDLKQQLQPEVDAYLARVPDDFLQSEIDNKAGVIDRYKMSQTMTLTHEGWAFHEIMIVCEEMKVEGLKARLSNVTQVQPGEESIRYALDSMAKQQRSWSQPDMSPDVPRFSGPHDSDPEPDGGDLDPFWSGMCVPPHLRGVKNPDLEQDSRGPHDGSELVGGMIIVPDGVLIFRIDIEDNQGRE